MIKLRIPIIKLPENPSLYSSDNALGKETFIKGEFNLNDVSFRVKNFVLTKTKLKRIWKWHHFAGLYEGLKSLEYRGSVITSLGKMVRLRLVRKRDTLNYFYELFLLLRKNKYRNYQ